MALDCRIESPLVPTKLAARDSTGHIVVDYNSIPNRCCCGCSWVVAVVGLHRGCQRKPDPRHIRNRSLTATHCQSCTCICSPFATGVVHSAHALYPSRLLARHYSYLTATKPLVVSDHNNQIWLILRAQLSCWPCACWPQLPLDAASGNSCREVVQPQGQPPAVCTCLAL